MRRSDGRVLLVHLVLVAVLTTAARLPFLARADRFFDSDEAVEGLMAQHVLRGERPVFMWGQQYKGVPEIYVASAVFRMTGAGVVPIKSVTLLCFIAFLCLQFIVLRRVFSTAIAWMATTFGVVASPALVLWSLSANAEIVMTLLAGAVMCLGYEIWSRTRSSAALALACAAAGFGLWVQQSIMYYLVAIVLTMAVRRSSRRELLRGVLALAPDGWSRWARAAFHVVVALGVLYALLGVASFLGGGFAVSPSGVRVTVTHPQKLWRNAALLFLAAVLARAAVWRSSGQTIGGKRLALGCAAFITGYSPVLVGVDWRLLSMPIARTDVAGVAASIPSIVREVLPILFRFRSPTTESLVVSPWPAVMIVLVVAISHVHVCRRALPSYFHAVIWSTVAVFLLSGAFVDAQSYRYLMPIYAALPVVYAVGVAAVLHWSRWAGTALFLAMVTLFSIQQIRWYHRLMPDVVSPLVVRCLDEQGIRAAYADYWLS